MNRKVLSLLIVAVMVLSVVPAVLPGTLAAQNSPENHSVIRTLEDTLDKSLLLSSYKTGLRWVSPEEYSKITGIKFKPLTESAFKEALMNAPYYPGRETMAILPSTTGYKVSSGLSLPPMVFNNLYLPPIGDQGYIGSCNAWSSTYYVWTYMMNWWRDNPYPRTPDVIMNPSFTYNLINGGVDEGSNPWDAMTLISTVGAVPLDAFPLYTYPPKEAFTNGTLTNYTLYYEWYNEAISRWPNITQWMIAPRNSGNDYMWQASLYEYQVPGQWYIIDLSNDTQWQYLKQLLAAGYVVQYAYGVSFPFDAVNIFDSADEILQALDYWASYVATATNNETYYQWVNETYLSNETFIQGLKQTFMPYTETKAFYDFTKETGWWEVWSKYIEVKYGRTYSLIKGGHAVTIVGYDDRVKTADGYGVVRIANSWGQNWGDGGYFYMSYEDIRFGEESFQLAWVYVPKAANYQPKLMSVVGIAHPLRGEVIDGTYDPSTYMPVHEAGIPIVAEVNGTPVWGMNFLDFYHDYLPENVIPYLANNRTLLYRKLPQAHPFPNSPMAFDVSGLGEGLAYYMEETGDAPTYMTIYTNVSDIIPDNITGEIYNFTLLYQGPTGDYMLLASADITNGTIPDGGWKVIPIEVPIVQYGSLTLSNSSTINFGNFSVDVLSLVPLKGAYVSIDGKEYQLSEENGGYYFYGTEIDQKLKLPAGTYNYTVVVVYPNGKEVALPTRTVTIEGPTVDILSPVNTVYNTSTVEVVVNVTDPYATVTNVKAYLNGKPLNLTASGSLYVATLTNLTNGEYKLTVIANDTTGAYGIATRLFVVHTSAKVTEVIVNNETNVTIGVVGGSANVTAENNTIVANVSTSSGEFTVEIPVVNNIPAVVVNASSVDTVVAGGSNATLVAGWNATLTEVSTKTTPVDTKGNKKVYSVTITANVSIGENGVAVVALRDVNISKVYVIKNGQKVQLTTNKSNSLGYYYKEGNVIFVVLKEDPIIVAQGTKEVTVPSESGISITTSTSSATAGTTYTTRSSTRPTRRPSNSVWTTKPSRRP